MKLNYARVSILGVLHLTIIAYWQYELIKMESDPGTHSDYNMYSSIRSEDIASQMASSSSVHNAQNYLNSISKKSKVEKSDSSLS